MKRIAAFEKVSENIFLGDSVDICPVLELAQYAYERIKLPKRATKGSAGYDFYAPFDFTLKPGETIKIPTDSLRGYLLNLVLHTMMTQLTKEMEVSAVQLQIKEGIA